MQSLLKKFLNVLGILGVGVARETMTAMQKWDQTCKGPGIFKAQNEKGKTGQQ